MEKAIIPFKKESYISPNIETVEIEIEQSILDAGSTGDLPGFDGEDW